jgi:hypothetical protein
LSLFLPQDPYFRVGGLHAGGCCAYEHIHHPQRVGRRHGRVHLREQQHLRVAFATYSAACGVLGATPLRRAVHPARQSAYFAGIQVDLMRSTHVRPRHRYLDRLQRRRGRVHLVVIRVSHDEVVARSQSLSLLEEGGRFQGSHILCRVRASKIFIPLARGKRSLRTTLRGLFDRCACPWSNNKHGDSESVCDRRWTRRNHVCV